MWFDRVSMPTTALARGTDLLWEPQAPGSARVALPGHGASGVHFHLHAGQLDVSMELVTGNKVDITVKPGLVKTLVTEAAQHLDLDPAPVCRRLRDELIGLAAESGATSDAGLAEQIAGLDLEAVLLGLSYPLTAPALLSGAAPVKDVPRWAAPVLASTDARAALTGLVGAEHTNRRGVRSLAESLRPPEGSPTGTTIALYPLVLAAVGVGTLDAERTANVLEATDPFHPEREWPTPDEIPTVRRALRMIGPERGTRILIDSVHLPDGPRRLVTASEAMVHLATVLPRRLPASLDELERLCVELTPVDPRADTHGDACGDAHADTLDEPARAPVADHPPPVRRRDQPGPEGRIAMVDRVFGTTAPVQHTDAQSSAAAFRYEPDLVVINGATTDEGRLTVVLPRTPTELDNWARTLHNCAGDYRDGIARRHTTLIGVRHHGQLSYLIEWRRPGVIRQFFGARNRRVPHTHVLAVMELLWHHRLIRADVFADLETGSAVPLAAD